MLPPLTAHVVGRPEAPGVVDHRAAAEAGAGEQADAPVGRRDAAAAKVEPPVPAQLRAVEVLLAVVPARLDHDDVEARSGQTPAAVPPPAPEPTTTTSHSSSVSPVISSGVIVFGGASGRIPCGPG